MIDSAADLDVIASKVSPQMASALRGAVAQEGFASDMGAQVVHMFANVWARPGMGARDRSLITVAMLVALRQTEELRPHAKLALTNGVTREELEELVIHASAYAGFPASLSAKAAITEALGG
jgi:4-carboxymuconolactone decarboxylase